MILSLYEPFACNHKIIRMILVGPCLALLHNNLKTHAHLINRHSSWDFNLNFLYFSYSQFSILHSQFSFLLYSSCCCCAKQISIQVYFANCWTFVFKSVKARDLMFVDRWTWYLLVYFTNITLIFGENGK
jgi:hypothetical protein